MIIAPSKINTLEEDTGKGFYDVIGLGEVVVDLLLSIQRFPKPDEKIYVKKTVRQAGGVTANFCVGVARQGLRVAFTGAIGDDLNGKFLRSKLIAENVADEFLFVLPGKKTPVNTVMVTESGEKAILQSEHMKLTLPGADLVTGDVIKRGKHLHLTAINFDTAFKAVKLAKTGGLTVSLDLESQVVNDYPEKIKDLLSYVDFLMPNKGGACTLTRTDNLKEASKILLSYGPNVVVMTLGEEGVLLTTEGRQERMPAFKVDNVVDTTGAGDAFNAGFIVGLLKGKSLDESIKRGQATAASKIQGVGA
ncbi:MAG: carbohydrate kinase family protein [Candidatus Hodarchaeales archaeon]